MSGFFGKLKPYSGAYHPSEYQRYSRGGGTALGTLGKAFAYKRPKMLSDGGTADDSSDPIEQIDAALASPQQQRQPSMGEQMLRLNKEWGGGPEGVSQRFAGGSPYDIARTSADLEQLDSDSLDKIDKAAAKLDDTVNDELESKEPGLAEGGGVDAFTKFWQRAAAIQGRARGGGIAQADKYLRQDIGGSGIHPELMPDYNRPVDNGPDNDLAQGLSTPLGGTDDQVPVKPRQGSRGTGSARAGSTVNKNPYATPLPDGHDLPPSASTKYRAKPNVTAAWTGRQRNPKGMHIKAPHSGEGLVLNVHLSNVGPHAVSLTHSGGVKMAERNLQSDARPAINPFQWGKSG